jgi:SAM-dependent methyltransferase
MNIFDVFQQHTQKNESLFGWNDYARDFTSITTQFQHETYREAASHLYGHVADFGCGGAKIAPILNGQCTRYTGYDASAVMVRSASQLIGKLPAKGTGLSIVHSTIDAIPPVWHDSAVSINSYYAWDDPIGNLKAISALLAPGSTFVLATPNHHLQMSELLAEAEKDLSMHPYWPAYKQKNQHLAANARLVSLNALISEVQDCGFEILEAHDRHFMRGLNFLVLRNTPS